MLSACRMSLQDLLRKRMFSFLKDKLKNAFSIFSKKVEESPAEEVEKVEELPVETVVEATPLPAQKIEPVQEFKQVEQVAVPEIKPIEVRPVPKEVSKPKILPREKAAPKLEVKAEKPVIVKPEFAPEIKQVAKPEIKPVEIKPVPEIKPEIKPAVKVTPVVKQVEKPEIKVEQQVIQTTPPTEMQVVAAQEEAKKKGWFGAITEAITTRKLSDEQFNELFWDVELAMLENNVAVEVIEKIKDDLRKNVVGKPLPRTKVTEAVMQTLKDSLSSLFVDSQIDILSLAKKHKPLVIAFVGINGSGKTTTIAKFVKDLQNKKLSVVLAAADTFRAAAIDQLQLHADALGCKLVKHDYGADPAAVAFDAIEHAKAKGKDVVLIDTAGRLHSNTNLVDELKKIVRVAKPHLKIFVGESITGNDCVEQAKTFDEAIGIDGIILSKADVDEKGGAALSISFVTKKPILYLGTGQTYDDLKLFDKNQLLAQVGV